VRAAASRPEVALHVDVWRVPLDARSFHGNALLSAHERERRDRYLSAEAASQFAAARHALRRLLGLRLDVDGARLRIDAGTHGKPFLPDHPQVRFSVTHAGALALIAFSDEAEIGIDLEYASSFAAASHLWPLACNASERRWLEQHPDQSERAFARLWTRKEALLKALGTGLASEPAGIDLSAQIEAKSGAVVVPLPGREQAPTLIWADLAPSDDALCAVAVVAASAQASIEVSWHDEAGMARHLPPTWRRP
jgi:4'-phosphopantetheinyl transferase